MKAAVIHAPHDLRIEEMEVEPMGPRDVKVRIRAGCICGSDLHYYHRGGFGAVRFQHPMVLGHEAAGDVAAVGDEVTRVRLGDRVAVNPSLPCGQCRYCLEGKPNECLDMRYNGSAMRVPHSQGLFREYVVCTEAQAVPAGRDVSAEVLAFAEPLSVALHACGQAGHLQGRRVLVTGVGPIGALCIMSARHAGAREIVATDVVDASLDTARRIEADVVKNTATEPGALDRFSASKGYFDVAFEASGAAPALAAALAAVRPGGTVVQLGLGGTDTAVPMSLVVTKEINLRGSFRFCDEFDAAVAFLASGTIDVRPLITEVVPLAEAVRAFELATDRTRAMKVQLAI